NDDMASITCVVVLCEAEVLLMSPFPIPCTALMYSIYFSWGYSIQTSAIDST
ncbi:hypothetical protein ACJX0J_039671, partial [Zea mays]